MSQYSVVPSAASSSRSRVPFTHKGLEEEGSSIKGRITVSLRAAQFSLQGQSVAGHSVRCSVHTGDTDRARYCCEICI